MSDGSVPTAGAGRVLGIDPGIGTTGWGVVEPDGAAGWRLVAAGAIRPAPEDAIGLRLRAVHEGVTRVLREHAPAAVAVEEAFGGVNIRSAIRLGEARAVCLLAAAQADLPVHEVPPALVKKAVAGHGRAGKEAVRSAVLTLLRAQALPGSDRLPHDATDALALALTASTRMEVRRRLGVPVGRRPRSGRRARWTAGDVERLTGGA